MSHMNTIAADFCAGLGKKALFLLASFPFFIVCIVKAVGEDFVMVKAKFGVPIQLKNIRFRIHFDNIDAYFVEDGEYAIPKFEADQDGDDDDDNGNDDNNEDNDNNDDDDSNDDENINDDNNDDNNNDDDNNDDDNNDDDGDDDNNNDDDN